MIDFFIRRPILASAIALLMVLAGVVSALTLPVSEFPRIVPGTVSVSTKYPGASAELTARVVTTPIEQQINGAEGVLYLSSVSSNDGVVNITVTFDVDYDLRFGEVEIQNAVEEAIARLPNEVQKVGVDIEKKSTDFAAIINLYSPSGAFDSAYLGNYADINVVDALERVEGVGSITNFGLRQYSIRVWLDPRRMADLGLNPSQIVSAVQQQNTDIPIGTIGQPPASGVVSVQYQLSALDQLPTPEAFEEIIVRSGPDGALVRLGDLGSVELGALDYGTQTSLNGRGAATLGIFQRPGANTFKVVRGVRAELEKLSARFPGDITYQVTYDATDFVRDSMQELAKTLVQAIVLVVLVVFIFLQRLRTTIIPALAIPVSLVATFAVLAGTGFSINILSLLGLVLAVGLVVDDAIVVVENVERRLDLGDSSVFEATSKAMREVGGSIVATTAVMLAVFVPASFAPGATGRLFNQFALTIAFSITLSAFNSLTLSPALCAVLLRPKKAGRKEFFIATWFNRVFDVFGTSYARFVGVLSRLWVIVLVVFLVLGWLLVRVGKETNQGFVPVEDQGWMFVFVELPPGASVDRTASVVERVSMELQNEETVADAVTISGYNFVGGYRESNSGVVFAILKPWSERTTKQTQVPGLIDDINARLREIPGAVAVAIAPPSIPGLGTTGGLEFEILDVAGKGSDALGQMIETFIEHAQQEPAVGKLLPTFTADVPQLYLDIDREKAQSLGVSIQDVYQTLQIYLGSVYVNNWNEYGQVYQVRVQAEGSARERIADIGDLHVANAQGEMVPLESIVSVQTTTAPDAIQRYNLYPSAKIIGAPKPGMSGAAAIQGLRQTADEVLVPAGFDFAWTGLVFEEQGVAKYLAAIFLLGLVTVYLVLAGLYESWTLPVVILLSVPLAILGALTALKLRHMPLDVYGQIALLMMIALAAKNQILIVAFAKQERESGKAILESAMSAAKIRLRPILMTKSAFIIGVLPLVFATGPGANTRHSIGTTVVGGMLAAAVLSLLLTPVCYVVVEWLREKLGFTGKGAAAS